MATLASVCGQANATSWYPVIPSGNECIFYTVIFLAAILLLAYRGRHIATMLHQCTGTFREYVSNIACYSTNSYRNIRRHTWTSGYFPPSLMCLASPAVNYCAILYTSREPAKWGNNTRRGSFRADWYCDHFVHNSGDQLNRGIGVGKVVCLPCFGSSCVSYGHVNGLVLNATPACIP